MIDEKDFIKFPLCVDLDGTLWAGDCLWFSMKDFLIKYPWKIFHVLFWWKKGRQILKYNIASSIDFDPSKLVFYKNIVNYLLALKEQGAKLYLVTGSDQIIADKVSNHLGFFEKAYGSNTNINLVATKKSELLNNLFGEKQYIYFGNEWKDRFVWEHSAAAVAVNISDQTKEWLEKNKIYTKLFTEKD